MISDIYAEFLDLAGFEGIELQEMLPEWIEASKRLGLDEDDVRCATRQWIPTYFDTELKGIRKLIGAFIREAIDLTKAREYKASGVKILYGILPAITSNYMAIKQSGKERVYVSFPDIFLVTVLNGFFHKINPYLETAEAHGMTYGCRHCALNKTRITARMHDVIPSPDVIWTWGYVCDEGPKTDEFINCMCSSDWDVLITRLPHDTHFGEKDFENERRIRYLARQMEDGYQSVQKKIGIEVTPKSITDAVGLFRTYGAKLAELISLVCSADPQPLGGTELSILGYPMAMPFNTGFDYVLDALETTIEDVKGRIAQGKGIVPKGSPSLGCYFVSSPVPWISKMFQDNGVGLSFSLNMTPTKKLLEPSRYDDPYMAAAETWLKRPQSSNLGYEIDATCEKVNAYKPDGMLMGSYDFDRWLGAHQKVLSMAVEEKTRVPHFYMESDFWEDRDYSQEALRTRIESICQIVKMNKMMKTA